VIARHLNELTKDLILLWSPGGLVPLHARFDQRPGCHVDPNCAHRVLVHAFSSLWVTVAPLSSPETNTPVLLPARFVLRQALRAFLAQTDASQVISRKAKVHQDPLNCISALLTELQVILR
jgi:hypothetical protein